MNAKGGLHGGRLVGAFLLVTCSAMSASASPRVSETLGQLRWNLRRSFDNMEASPWAARAVSTLAEIAWFRLDVPDKLPAEVKTEPRDLPEADLEIDEVEYLPPTQFAEWANLSFTIRAARGAKRSLVTCARGPEPLIAGLMRAFNQDGKELLLEIQPCYDCSHRGQPWQLTPVTRGGTSTTIGFKFHNGRPKCIKLEVLTERGLAEFSLEP